MRKERDRARREGIGAGLVRIASQAEEEVTCRRRNCLFSGRCATSPPSLSPSFSLAFPRIPIVALETPQKMPPLSMSAPTLLED